MRAVGILAAHSADFKGAGRIVVIDNQQYRLDFIKKRIPRVETINFDEQKDVRTAPAWTGLHACLRIHPACRKHIFFGMLLSSNEPFMSSAWHAVR